MDDFYEIIDKEIVNAIPSNLKMVAKDKLLGKEPCRIRFAFNSLASNSKSKLINILALQSSLSLDVEMERNVMNLRNYILSKNCILIVVCEVEASRYLSGTSVFVAESLDISHPNYLSISCAKDKDLMTTIDGVNFECLSNVIHDVWSGELRFFGPELGIQNVNLEIMNDQCWKCNQKMKTVTGIVFPNCELSKWDNDEWLYYNQLVSLSSLNMMHGEVIRDFVTRLRITDSLITPVDFRYSNTLKSKYWAAACPHCDALRGDFHVTDYRMQYLHDFSSRFNGDLQYYSMSLNVDDKLMKALQNGGEVCPQACVIGWSRD